MVEDRIVRLTERQKDCLRLVAQGYTSKEIGRQLGLSYSTVDNHLLAAVQILELGGRAEAARCFAQYEQRLGQELPRQPAALVDPSTPADDRPAIAGTGRWKWLKALLPPIGGRENDLSPLQKLLAIARIALFSTLVFVACVIVIRMCFDALS